MYERISRETREHLKRALSKDKKIKLKKEGRVYRGHEFDSPNSAVMRVREQKIRLREAKGLFEVEPGKQDSDFICSNCRRISRRMANRNLRHHPGCKFEEVSNGSEELRENTG